jgi:hypothetical protein
MTACYSAYVVYGMEACGAAARCGGLFAGLAFRPVPQGTPPVRVIVVALRSEVPDV